MPHLTLIRDARLFMRRPELRDELSDARYARHLAPYELLRAACPADYVMRLGRARVTEFLPDGREVTRAVLQSGSCFTTREEAGGGDSSYPLDRTTVMALGDAELWRLPAGTFDELNIG
ncbi:cyclic nucleotide-binding domain-containing protein [bacterium]|nr:cyclic nucleotide-binding domain-containing protein [bacterium]MBU1073799.1 cyclic nucleotide-binding domain-containing protein [bacterium]